MTKILVVMQVGDGRRRWLTGGARIEGQAEGRMCAGVQHGWLKTLLLRLDIPLWKWESEEGKKPVWVMLSDFLYAQVIKHQRRRRTVEVERRMLVGEEGE